MVERESADSSFSHSLLKSLEDTLESDSAFGNVAKDEPQQKSTDDGRKNLSPSASPLLDTGQMHSDDPTICLYCNKTFRKVNKLLIKSVGMGRKSSTKGRYVNMISKGYREFFSIGLSLGLQRD